MAVVVARFSVVVTSVRIRSAGMGGQVSGRTKQSEGNGDQEELFHRIFKIKVDGRFVGLSITSATWIFGAGIVTGNTAITACFTGSAYFAAGIIAIVAAGIFATKELQPE